MLNRHVYFLVVNVWFIGTSCTCISSLINLREHEKKKTLQQSKPAITNELTEFFFFSFFILLLGEFCVLVHRYFQFAQPCRLVNITRAAQPINVTSNNKYNHNYNAAQRDQKWKCVCYYLNTLTITIDSIHWDTLAPTYFSQLSKFSLCFITFLVHKLSTCCSRSNRLLFFFVYLVLLLCGLFF